MSTVIDNTYKTVSEAASILGLTVQRVRQLIKSDQLKAEKVHERLWIIPRRELDSFKRRERPTGVHVEHRR